ncbi:GNAT family N-acetyltransferase [Leptolinea tardivitalis]|uniref:GNAT family N-acetyltransferase n=1 Tax=Leptolinea tardivitalis TaxID=229920 RepID=UPI000781EE85|nr:N-acetyltransferase [Leptolinea tardivitalis]GAP21349.1 acetyltransferase [Leptolinea tardivitalis]
MYSLAPARLFDLSALKKLEDVVFKEDAWPVLDILTILIIPGGINLKAQDDKSIIGFISVEQNLFEPVAWVSTVGVAPEYRRQGVGKSLMMAVEKLVRRPVICLCVRKSNEGAIHLYEELGYQKKETRPQYYADGEDAYVMTKKLDKI